MSKQVEFKHAHGHSYRHVEDGPEGDAWYAWSDEYPEDGYILFDTEEALLDGLRKAAAAE